VRETKPFNTYTSDDSSTQVTEQFEMVVLSTGLRFPPTWWTCRQAGNHLKRHHFADRMLCSGHESKPGIYVCGMFEAPKDISGNPVQASGAACNAVRHLGPAGSAEEGKRSAPERDISGEEPTHRRVVCDCGAELRRRGGNRRLVDYPAFLPAGRCPNVGTAVRGSRWPISKNHQKGKAQPGGHRRMLAPGPMNPSSRTPCAGDG
jgi:heterodisulfide reductase subunit A